MPDFDRAKREILRKARQAGLSAGEDLEFLQKFNPDSFAERRAKEDLIKNREERARRIKLQKTDPVKLKLEEAGVRETPATRRFAATKAGRERLRQIVTQRRKGIGGSELNRQRSRFVFSAEGRTDFADVVEREERERRLSQKRAAGLRAEGAAQVAQDLTEKQKREFAEANPQIAQAVTEGRQPRPQTRKEELEQESAGVQGIEEREKRQLTRDLLEAESPEEGRQLLAAQRQREELRQRFAEARAAQPNVFDTTIDRAAQVIDDSERAVKKLDEEVIGKGSRLQGPPAPPKAGDTFVIGSTAVATPEDKTTGKFTTPFLAGQVAPQQQQSTGRTISPKGGDPLAQATKQLEKTGKESSNPLVAFPAGFGTEFGNFASFLVDIERKGGQKFVELVKGERQPAPKPLPIPETATGQFVSGPVEGVAKAIETGDVSQIGVESRKGAEKAAESFQKNPAFSAGALAAFLLPVSPKAVKLIPLRLSKTTFPTTTSKTVTKVKPSGQKVKELEPETTFRGLSVGFDDSRPVIGKAGKKVILGRKPTPEEIRLGEIEPTGRLFEPLTRGSKLLEDIVTSKKGNQTLREAGVPESRIGFIEEQKEAAKLLGKAPSKVQRDDPGNKFLESLTPKQTEAEKAFLSKSQKKVRGKLGEIKGGAARVFTLSDEFVGKTKDIDVDVGVFKAAKKFAEENKRALDPFSEQGEAFFAKSGKVERAQATTGFPSGLAGKGVFFQGTTKQSAEAILRSGFDVSKAGTSTRRVLEKKLRRTPEAAEKRAADITGEGIFFTPNPRFAARFGQTAAKTVADRPALLKIELKESAKIFRSKKFDPTKKEFAQELESARAQGFEGILKPIGGPGSNLELVLFSGKPVKSVSRVKEGLVPKPGTEKKVAEFLAFDDPEQEVLGQLAKSKKVAGQKRKKAVTAKTQQGKLKVSSLQSEGLNLIASTTGIKGAKSEGSGIIGRRLDIGAPGDPKTGSFRFTKEPVNLFRVEKSGARLLEQAGKKEQAARLNEIAENIKKVFPEIDFGKELKAGQLGPSQIGASTPSPLSQAAKSPVSQGQAAAAGIEISRISPIEPKDGILKDFVPAQTKKARVTAKKEDITSTPKTGPGASRPIPSGTSPALPRSSFSFSTGNIVRSDLPVIGPQGKSPRSGISKGQRPKVNISISSPKSKPKKDEFSFIQTSPAGPSRGGGSPGSPFVGSPGPSPGSGLVKSPLGSPRVGRSRFSTLPGSGLIAPPGTRKKAGLIFLLPDGKPKDRINIGPSERIFAVDSSDPFRPGVIFTAGVPEFQVSKSPDLFEKIDIQLGKARKKKGAEKPEFPDVVDIGGRGAVGALQPRAAKRTRKKPRRSAIGRQAARVRTSKRTKRKVTGKKSKGRKKSSRRSR